MAFSRVEQGDLFLIDKINSSANVLSNDGMLKAEKVIRSVIDGSCIVVLEKKTFEKEEELKAFMQGKKYVK
jgi:hypothetical protein